MENVHVHVHVLATIAFWCPLTLSASTFWWNTMNLSKNNANSYTSGSVGTRNKQSDFKLYFTLNKFKSGNRWTQREVIIIHGMHVNLFLTVTDYISLGKDTDKRSSVQVVQQFTRSCFPVFIYLQQVFFKALKVTETAVYMLSRSRALRTSASLISHCTWH